MKIFSSKRNRTLFYVLGALLVLLIAAAVVKARRAPKGEEVTVEQVQKRDIRETVTASGKIFPEIEVKISSDVSGEIVELYVEEGDSVRAGQVLAKIKPDEYQSAVERGEAAVNTAKSQRQISNSNVQGSAAQIDQMKADRARIAAQLDVARKTHERNEKLLKDGVISQSDFDASYSNLKVQESSLAAADASLKAAETNRQTAMENVQVAGFGINSAQASLKELRTSLQKTIVTAPVSGIISKLNVEKGERVVGTLQMAGTEMMRVANFSSMEVQVEVSENDILKVVVGDEADIDVDAYLGKKFKGKVSEIAHSASNVGTAVASLNSDQVANFIVKVRIDPASYADMMTDGKAYPFRPGMSASVDIFTHTAKDALSVPIIAVTVREEDKEKALDDKNGKDNKEEKPATETAKKADKIKEIVYVMTADTVSVREVTTGIQDNDHIVIESGLKEGETVVIGPYDAIAHKLKQGAKVRLAEKK